MTSFSRRTQPLIPFHYSNIARYFGSKTTIIGLPIQNLKVKHNIRQETSLYFIFTIVITIETV